MPTISLFNLLDPKIRRCVHDIWAPYPNHLLKTIPRTRHIRHSCKYTVKIFLPPPKKCYKFYLNEFSLYTNFLMTLVSIWSQKKDVDPGPTPLDLRKKNLLTFVTPVLFDTPKWGKNFGDCIKQPPKLAKPGDIVSAVFVSILSIDTNFVKMTRTKYSVISSERKLWKGKLKEGFGSK